MNRKELLKLAEESRKLREIYYRPGLDDTSRTFLFAIRENLTHQNRREKFKEYSGYSGYESRY